MPPNCLRKVRPVDKGLIWREVWSYLSINYICKFEYYYVLQVFWEFFSQFAQANWRQSARWCDIKETAKTGMVVVISLVLEINLIKNPILNSSTRLLIYWTQVVCFDRSRQNKHRHRRHIASCWSPCLSLMAAAGTIRKSIVLRFFWYPILYI